MQIQAPVSGVAVLIDKARSCPKYIARGHEGGGVVNVVVLCSEHPES